MKYIKIIALFLTALLFSLLALVGYSFFYLNEELELPESIEIKKGSNQNALDALKAIGIETNLIDKLILQIIGGSKSGNISLEGANSRLDLLKALAKGRQKNISITLIPGETTEIFFREISKKHGFKLEKLKKAYYEKTQIPEGRLVPETYSFDLGASEEDIINKLLDFSDKRFEELLIKYSTTPDELNKKIIIASIIEKEAASKEEMPLIASVIYNRLKIGMPLQMDGTLNYGVYSGQKVTPQRIREDNSVYNTYKNRGLPPYPVCNPSKEAIEAAFKPADTDYYYFVKGRDGRHKFSNSYTEHKSNIKNVKESNR